MGPTDDLVTPVGMGLGRLAWTKGVMRTNEYTRGRRMPPCRRPRILESTHSLRSAATGSLRAAFIAGRTPNSPPTTTDVSRDKATTPGVIFGWMGV